MTGLTGVKDIDLKILQTLSDIDLCNICSTNKRLYKICNEESFWLNRLLLKMSHPDNNIESINELRENKEITYKDLYIYLFGKDRKEALFKSVQLDNTTLFRKIRSLDKNNIYGSNSDLMREAGRYNSFNIMTYLLMNENYPVCREMLAHNALTFANEKVFKWLDSMGLVNYDKYIKNWVGDILNDLFFVKLSLRLTDENLSIIIKLYNIVTKDSKASAFFGTCADKRTLQSKVSKSWKEVNDIPIWIDEGLTYSSANENVKNKLRDHVRSSLKK